MKNLILLLLFVLFGNTISSQTCTVESTTIKNIGTSPNYMFNLPNPAYSGGCDSPDYNMFSSHYYFEITNNFSSNQIGDYWNQLINLYSNSSEYTTPVKKRGGFIVFPNNPEASIDNTLVFYGLRSVVIQNPIAEDDIALQCPFEDIGMCDDYSISWSDVVISDGDDCYGTIYKRTWTICEDDLCNSTFMYVQIFQIVGADTTPPTFIDFPADISVECDEEVPFYGGYYTDNCSEIDNIDLTFSQNIVEGVCDADFTIARTYAITDENGNSNTQIWNIHVQDTNPPYITDEIPDNYFANYGFLNGSINAEDNCTSAIINVTTSGDDAIITAEDECGNITTETTHYCAPEIAPILYTTLFDVENLPDLDVDDYCNQIPYHDVHEDQMAVEYILNYDNNSLDIQYYWNKMIEFSNINENEYLSAYKKRLGSFYYDDFSINYFFFQTIVLTGISPVVILDPLDCEETLPCPFEDESLCDQYQASYTETLLVGDACESINKATWAFDNGSEVVEYEQILKRIDTEAPVFTYIGTDMTVDSYEDIPLNDFEVSDNCGNMNFYIDEWGYSDDGIQYITRGTFAIDDCGNSSFVEQFYTIFNPNEAITIQAKVFLQGPFDINTQLMNDNLRTLGHIPTSTPWEFYSGGCQDCGSCGANTDQFVLDVTGNNAIVDWLFIEVYENYPSGFKGKKCALLQRDGDIVASDGTSLVTINGVDADNVIILIRHRNHFGIRTLNTYATNETIIIDFSDPSTLVYGTIPMIEIGNTMTMIAGDANNDGQINPVDKNDIWRVQNGHSYNYQLSGADFNLDGAINPVDKNSYWRINNSMIEQLD